MGVKIEGWQRQRQWMADLLKRRTGEDLETWNARIGAHDFASEDALRSWLAERDVTGYSRDLLVMERFGYPDYLSTSADELVDGQYADRPDLRPILDALLARVATFGDMSIQARKGYISLVGPRRTWGAIQPTTKRRVDLGLRLDGHEPGGRLEPAKSMGSGQVNLRIGLTTVDEVDDEVDAWLQRAYEANR
ncbi:MAG TPA: DUF5655 domain-containing protein [Nitrolancea sp.]|nr:DUF5655 domain-containing protein [Nitrolancea sp.]